MKLQIQTQAKLISQASSIITIYSPHRIFLVLFNDSIISKNSFTSYNSHIKG